MQAYFLFLGTGGSAGTPIIGCECPVCSSSDPFNKRLRPSGLITAGDKRILIDTTPDLREQALRASIKELDGVILTHAHYDHIGGLDELRIYYLRSRRPVPVLLSESTYEEVRRRYDYLFHEQPGEGISLPAQLSFHILEEKKGRTLFCDIPLQYFSYIQGNMEVNGFRIGNFAYVSDIRKYTEDLYQELVGVKYLVVSALGPEPSTMHLSFEEAIAFSRKVGAETTWFTHLSHRVDHQSTNQTLPEGIQLAYDGLKVEFTVHVT